jgi:hypothetical protein
MKINAILQEMNVAKLKEEADLWGFQNIRLYHSEIPAEQKALCLFMDPQPNNPIGHIQFLEHELEALLNCQVVVQAKGILPEEVEAPIAGNAIPLKPECYQQLQESFAQTEFTQPDNTEFSIQQLERDKKIIAIARQKLLDNRSLQLSKSQASGEVLTRHPAGIWSKDSSAEKKRKAELQTAAETTKKEEVKEKLQEIIKLTEGLSLKDQKEIWHWLEEQKPVAMFPSDEGTTLNYP